MFLRALRKAVDDLQWATGERFGQMECRVAWDGGRSSFRSKLFPEYKANRKVGLEDAERIALRQSWDQQWRGLTVVLRLLGVQQARYPGWEADDVVAMWWLRNPERQKAILSGDRDLWQLVDERTRVLRPEKSDLTLENFAAEVGVEDPWLWLRFRALTGDSSDGIPGVGGIGDKRAHAAVADWSAFVGGGNLSGVRGARFDLNMDLMDLRWAAERLLQTIADKGFEEQHVETPPARDLALARRWLIGIGAHALVGGWARWSVPFWRLAN